MKLRVLLQVSDPIEGGETSTCYDHEESFVHEKNISPTWRLGVALGYAISSINPHIAGGSGDIVDGILDGITEGMEDFEWENFIEVVKKYIPDEEIPDES